MKTREQKGITLIALIVTIIVLLILAGISIGAITGDNGIINQSKDAKDDTQYAQWEEQIDVAILDAENKHKDATMDDVIDELIDKKIIDDDSQVDKETGTVTTNEPSYVFEDKLKDYIEVFTADKLKAGEYVYYEDATGTTRKCIVLWDESSGYGTQIITLDTVGDVTLGSTNIDEAIKSYNNAITTLNNEAMKYLNSTYASDARCVGSVPNDKNSESDMYVSSEFSQYSRVLRDVDTNYQYDYNQMKNLGIYNSLAEYWFASRCFSAEGEPSKSGYPQKYFSMRLPITSNTMPFGALVHIEIEESGSNKATPSRETRELRPVFTLKSEVKIAGGEGTKDNPYTLEI